MRGEPSQLGQVQRFSLPFEFSVPVRIPRESRNPYEPRMNFEPHLVSPETSLSSVSNSVSQNTMERSTANRDQDVDSDDDQSNFSWYNYEREPWNPDYCAPGYYWPGASAAQPYCDTMYHTRFYPQRNPVEVKVGN